MEFSKKDIILKSWNVLMGHMGLWILIMLFIFSLNIITSIVQEKLLEDITAQAILFIVAAYLFQSGLNLGMLKVALNIHNKIEVDFGQIFGSFHLLMTFVMATIIFLFLIILSASLGIVLLFMSVSDNFISPLGLKNSNNVPFIMSLLIIIIPATYASIRMQYYNYFLVDKECGAIVAIKNSIKITQGSVGKLFVLGAALSIIILISMLPLMLGLLISIPLATMVNTRIYLMLKENLLDDISRLQIQ